MVTIWILKRSDENLVSGPQFNPHSGKLTGVYFIDIAIG